MVTVEIAKCYNSAIIIAETKGPSGNQGIT